jgi:hypothetical protein
MRPLILAATSSDELAAGTISAPLREVSGDKLVETVLSQVGELKESTLMRMRYKARNEGFGDKLTLAKRASFSATVQHNFKQMFNRSRSASEPPLPSSAADGSFSLIGSASDRGAGSTERASEEEPPQTPSRRPSSSSGNHLAQTPSSSSRRALGSLVPNKLGERRGSISSAKKMSRAGGNIVIAAKDVGPAPYAVVRSSTRMPLPQIKDEDEDEAAACGSDASLASPAARAASAARSRPQPLPRGGSGDVLPVVLSVVFAALLATSRRLTRPSSSAESMLLLQLPPPPSAIDDSAFVLHTCPAECPISTQSPFSSGGSRSSGSDDGEKGQSFSRLRRRIQGILDPFVRPIKTVQSRLLGMLPLLQMSMARLKQFVTMRLTN